MKTKSEEFVKLNQKMLEIAKEAQEIELEKYKLFEDASLEIREKIESYYKGISKEIDEYEFDFFEIKLPRLNEKLQEYNPESNTYKNYEKSINRYEISFWERIQDRVKMLHDNQKNLIASSIETKNKVLDNSNLLIQKRMQMLDKSVQNSQQFKLDFKSNRSQKLLSNSKEIEQDENEIQ
jgi:hypothetical protein